MFYPPCHRHLPKITQTRWFNVVILTAFLLALPIFCQAQATSTPQNNAFTVQWHNSRLDVNAADADLKAVMCTIAEKTGLEIKGNIPLTGRVQTHIAGQSLVNAIKSLLPAANFLFVDAKPQANAHPVLTIFSVSPSESHQTEAQTTTPIDIPASAGYVPDVYRKLYVYAETGNLKALKKAALNGDSATQAISMKLLAAKDPALATNLATKIVASTDPNRRLSALQQLSDLDNNAATQMLGTALHDPDFSVRNAAVLGLSSQTAIAAIGYLADALQDGDGTIRMLALELLAQKGADGVVGIKAALNSTDPQLSNRAQELLDTMVSGE